MSVRILFITSNGTGLGHLTRAMAISRRLGADSEPSILTLSAAAPVAAREGFHVEYFPSHTAAAAEAPRRWDRRLRRRIELLLEESRPQLLVFDGAHPYDGLVAALRAARRSGVAAVWCRRGLWQPGFGAAGIYWESAFDLVLEPGELAQSEDRGLTAAREGASRVAPIVYLDDGELLDREQAIEQLGLDAGRRHALVALGQGAELDHAVQRSLARLARHPEIQVVALESSLGRGLAIPEGVVHLRATYPISRYYRAFDLAVSAAGYNAFHELIAHGVPALFVPMPRQLDDQAARARWAREAGVGEGVEGPLDPELEDRLRLLVDEDARAGMREAIAALRFENGAGQAAAVLKRASDASLPHTGNGAPQSSQRSWDRLAVSAQLVKRVGLRLPAIVARRAIDRARNPPPPAARAICPVLGLEGDELIATLTATAGREGIEPSRLLAITDSLDFAALRRAGFAFEYVPNRERAKPVLESTGEPYEAFVRRRVTEAAALRRPARAVAAAAAP